MKTNFTMTKRLLFGFAALAMVISSCEEDPIEVPAPDIAGIYNFTSATLVDGDIGNDATTDLFIAFGSTNPDADPPYSASAQVGDVPTTSFFVNAVLSGLAPCVNPDVAVTYQINIKSDGGLAFICTSEGGTSEDNGSWAFADDNKTVILTIESSTLGTVIVKIETATFVTGDSGIISGTINSLPMIKNGLLGVGAPLDPNDASAGVNLQFIAIDVILSK